jgi:hypothetical protein
MVSAVPIIVRAPYTMILTPGDIPRSFKLNLGNSSGSFFLADSVGVWFDASLEFLAFIGALPLPEIVRETSKLVDRCIRDAIIDEVVGA